VPTQAEILSLCRQSLIGYAIAQWEGYRPAAHHRKIARALERVSKGECKRLMIFMPPRHGKSMLASEYFPAWYFGHHPNHQIIHTTYAQDLADDFGRKVRNQIGDPMYGQVFQSVRLNADSTAASRFHVMGPNEKDQDGVYHAVGIGGPATGRGANLLLIDDPVKNREEADSEVMREKVKDWYKSVAYTRLMTGGAIVVIQTRWHDDDLAGWLLREHKHEGWEVIDMPALSDDEQTALWPEAFPVSRLKQIRETIGPRDWEALYQQRPRPAGGAEFKRHWIQYLQSRSAGTGMNKIMLVDPASRKKKTSDFTSIWIIGLGEDGNYYVLDMVRDRLNLTERAETVIRLHRKWKPFEVRYEQYGMMADIEHIRSEQERRNYRFVIREVGGTTAKEDRIRRLIPLFETNKFWFPQELMYTNTEGREFDLVNEFIETEYLSFPVGRHDDMLDALARIAEPNMDTPWPRQQEFAAPVLNFGVLDPIAGY